MYIVHIYIAANPLSTVQCISNIQGDAVKHFIHFGTFIISSMHKKDENPVL